MGLNHVYKVIWNKTKGCYVVVSELAKRVGRNKAKAIVMATAAMAMVVTPAVMNVDQVEASVLIGNADGTTISADGSTVNSWGITIGGGITNAGSHSVHVGDATLEEGERNVIIGTHATAGVDNGVRRFVRQSTAIGGGASANEGARAFGDQSIAIGANTIAEGNSSIAIGNDDVDRAVDKQIKYTNPDGVEETNNLGNAYNKLTGKNLLSDGGQYADTRSGEAAIAIGVKAEAGDISLALGTGAKAKKVNTVSIGTGATAGLDNSVAIGGGAVADKDSQGTKQTSTTINGIIYKWAGGDTTNPGDVVSFGKPGFERQLKNIAAGEISSTSTDAINGSQIHSLVEKITGTPKLSYTTQDGTPVYKFGDKFYKVNEKGQRISAAGKPEVGTNQHGQLVDEDNNVIEPIDSATTPLKTALVNSSPEAGKTGTTSPTALNNITSNLVNFDAPNVNGKVPAKNTLRNLVNDAVSDDTVATVGDLRNMGWIVSADKTTGADGTATDTAYSETVKNAEEVKFVGTGMAVVSGKTENGIRTITVDVQGGNTTAASPVVYTKAGGTKVYPVEGPNGTTYHTTPEGKGPNDETVDGNDVITSVNGPRGTQTPSVLSNVAGNLEGAKPNSTAPTTSATAPTLGTAAGQVNVHNAATVGDVLNAGWNLQNNDAAKDFVKAYDTVNFVNGDGTTAVVETTDNTVSKIKYNVNTGNGLEKTTDNKIAVKPGDKSLDVTEAGVTVKKADQSLEVTDAGLKVKTDNKTITVGDNGLTVNTGTVNSVDTGTNKGTVAVPDTDAGKLATVDTVVKAVNSASFTLKASATTDGTRNANSTVDANGEAIKAGSTVELIAGKNLDVQHDTNGKITFATKDNVSFETVQVGGSEGPKFAKAADGSIKVSDKDGTEAVKITNVKNGDISADSKDAINGSQLHKLAKNTIKLAGKNGETASGETDGQALDKEGGIKFTVKSSNGDLLEVTATGDTITLTPKTATLTTTGGVPAADTSNGKLVTADQLITALTEMGWKATAGNDGTGTVDGNTEELIKAGNTVTFKAGDNLTVKQAGKEFIYSLQKELTGLTSAEFKNAAGDKTVINHDGVTITPADATKQPVSVTKDGLNNGGNAITNVAGNLEGAKANTTEPTTSATAPTLGTAAGQVNANNAATVGDVLQAGWNLQNNGTAKDLVKPYDTVNFVDGDGTTAVVETTDNTVSKIKYNVNTGNGLEKTTDNKIAVKPGDKSLDVTEAGVTVKKADQSLEVTDAGLKVKTDNKTITVGDNGLTVNTGTVNSVDTGTNKGTVAVPDTDAGKLATVDTVVKAVNSASFTLKASATTDGTRNANSTVDANGEAIKAGSTVELIAGKNLDVQHDTNGKITFATKDNVTFETVQVGGDQGPKLSKSDAGDIKVSGSDGTTPVKVTNVKDGDISANSKDAINGGQLHKLAKNTIKLAGKNGEEAATETDTQTLDKENGIAFTVKSSDGTLLEVTAQGDTITLTPKVGSITTDTNGVPTADVTNGKLVTAEELVTALKGMGWKATAGKDGTGTVDGTTEELIKAGETVTFKAGDNLAVKQAGKEFIYSLQKELTGLTSAEFKNAAGDKTVINHDGVTITPTDATKQAVSVTKDGLNNGGNQITNVTSGLVNHTEADKHDLRNLTNAAVPDTTAATVGDLRNMGWVVSSNKTTGDLEHAYSATVKNANEVKFVGTGTAIVSGETKDGVRTITVNVDDQVSANNATTPVAYTKADGTKVYPIKGENGVITYHTTPDGKGDNDQEVLGTEVITSVNSPDGTTTPATLANVAGNLDGAKKDTMAPKTEAAAPNTTNKDGDKYINPNNAATVGDVLNAGWNLQENGTAKDFVKPYDTVNFINGANTTAVVTTSEDGSTNKVTYNVTGLPVSYTTEDGKPVSKVGDKFYKVNEKGQPLAEDGTPAAGTDKDGNPITADGTVIKAIDPTVDPLKTALVNPNAPDAQTTTPTQLGNVANGADTFKPANDVKQANDGKWYNATDVEPNGKVKDAAKSVASPVATKNAAGDVLEKGKDGNWYKASDLENGEPKPNVDAQTPVVKPENAEKAGLVNFEGSNPNNAATVGDLQNLGFIVSAVDNGYTEQMRNANKVEFKGSNGVSVTGKTLEDGTREITVALKEGRVTNNVIITKADGTEVHGERGEDGKYYQYEKDPVTGQPKKVEVPVVPGDTVTNDGDAYVTGNSVATAIQKSGWNIGIGSTDKAFSEEEKTYEHVNPNDHVKYVNGDNTTVSMAVDPEKDRDGTTVTTTYVKVDVKRDLKIDSLTTGGPAKDKDGNSLQEINGEYYPANAVEKDGKVYPAGTVFIDGKAYPAGSAKDPNTNGVVKDGQPATEVQPLTATPKDKVADGKDGAMTVKDAKGKDGVSATAKDGKGVLTLNNAGTDKDGKDASTVNISTGKAPTDLGNTPKDGSEVPTMDRIQYTDGTGTSYNVATMNDGLRFVGDDDKAIDKTLNSTLTLTGGNREATNKPVAEEATTTGNIGVFNKDGKLSIQLAKDLDKLNSANFESKTDKAGNPLKAVDGKYYPENSVVQEGKVYPEGTVIIDNKPYPAGTTKDVAGNVVNNGKPATEATPINPIDSKQVQDGPTSKLTGTGLNFNTPAPKDENGNPLVLVDGKYYKVDNLENGKPKAEAKPEAVKPAQSTAITPDGLAITPDTAKVVDPKTGEVTVDSTKVVSFGAPSIVTDPTTGKAVIDPKTGEPVMKSGISAGGQVMSNVAPGVLDTDAVNVSQLKGVAHNINMRMNRMGAQAAAMASLQSIQYDPLEPTQISAGVGHYKGASALALGVNHFKNESTMFHMGASLNGHGDESMINASVTWKFGGRADETAVKDTFRQGPISASYTLQDKVSALEEQNQVLKEQVAELFRRLNEKA